MRSVIPHRSKGEQASRFWVMIVDFEGETDDARRQISECFNSMSEPRSPSAAENPAKGS